jgi:hypothetical protein
MALTVFLDANVLYPAELRSFLMYLADAGLFQAKWSDAVHQEWISSLLKNRRDLTRRQLMRTRLLMERAAPDALVTGYDALIPKLTLPDPDDRHVFAAAIHSGSEIILTKNLKHFPSQLLRRYGIRAQPPEGFVLGLLAADHRGVADAANTHRASMKNPTRTVVQYLAMLHSQGLPKSAGLLHGLMHPE